MSDTVHFEATYLGDPTSEEVGCLGILSGRIVAVLVRSPGLSDGSEQPSWYLETGFGLCDQEGLMFSSLEAAKLWIIDRIGVERQSD